MKEVRKGLRIRWYRSPVEPDRLRGLTRRNDLKGLYQSMGHLILVACTGLLTYYLFSQRVWVGFAAALFLHGTVYSFLRQAGHELSHGTIFRAKWLNGFFLRIYSLLSWYNFHHYKMSHMYHHLYTLHPEGDREVVLPTNPSLKAVLLLQLFTFNVSRFVGFLKTTARESLFGRFSDEWSRAIYADQERARRKAINWVRILVLFNAGIITVSIIFKLWMLPVLTTFSLFIGNWWRYFVGLPMHAGLRDNVPDFRKCVRTIKLDPFSKFLYWRMNYHTEHHMYAAVPCYNLRKLQKAIEHDMPRPRSLIVAWREMRETWKRQQEDPLYQYDTPVPSKGTEGSEKGDPLASSIGDIAPTALDD